MNSTLQGFIVLGCFLLAVTLLVMLFLRKQNAGEYITEVASSDDDPILKAEAEGRTNLLNSMVDTIARTFYLTEEKTKVTHDELGMNHDCINIDSECYSFKLQCNWNANQIKIFLHFTIEEVVIDKKITIRIRHGFINVQKFQRTLDKWLSECDCNMFANLQEMYNEAYQAGYAIANENHDDEFYKHLFQQILVYFEIRTAHTQNKADFINLTRLLAYGWKFLPEEMKELCSNDEDAEETVQSE